MKTIHKTMRIKPITLNKIQRYYEGAKIRQILEALTDLTENNAYIRNKLLEQIKKGAKK